MGQENSKKSQDASTPQDSSIAIGKRWSYSDPSTKDKLLDEKSKPGVELLPQQTVVKPGDHSMPKQKPHDEESKPEVELPPQQTVVKPGDHSMPKQKLHDEESKPDHVELPPQQTVVKPGDHCMPTKKEVGSNGGSPQLPQNGDSVTRNSAISSQQALDNVQTIPDEHRPEQDTNSRPKHESPEPIKPEEEVVNEGEISDGPKKKGYMQETTNGTQKVEDNDQQQAAPPNTSDEEAAGKKVENHRAKWVDQQPNQPVDATIAKSVNNSLSDEYAVKTGVRWDY